MMQKIHVIFHLHYDTNSMDSNRIGLKSMLFVITF